MTLHVPFEQFSKTVQRLLGTKEAFVTAHGHGTLVTAAEGKSDVLIVCYSDLAVSAAKTKLKAAGLETFDGVWKLTDEAPSDFEEPCDAFVAAVAYKSAESKPGVWVDAHRTQPTQVQVLRVMFEEFRETGELPDVSFEEFVRLSEPNVVIVSPIEMQNFLEKKTDA